jgi:hypothetical protein
VQSEPITTDVVSSNLDQDEVYNIMWSSLLVTCDRSVVFSGSSNQNNAHTNYYQINKWNSKNSACLDINFIKVCPEIALKYFFEKMWFYMKYIVKNRSWRNTYVHGLYIVAVSFIGGGNWRSQRIPQTCRKSLTNFITECCTPRPDRDSNSQHQWW